MSIEIEKSIPSKLRGFVNFPGINSSKSVFKTGSIELNGKRILVASNDTLESFASKVNAKNYATKVKAEIITAGTQKKLLLKSKNDILDFHDISGIFTNSYKLGKIGVDKNSLIQVIKDSSSSKPSEVSFNYYRILNKHSSLSVHNVSELNKFELSRYTTNNSADDAPKLVALPKVFKSVAPVPITVPSKTIDIAAIDNTRKKKINDLSKYIIDGAIFEAIKGKKLEVPTVDLQQKLKVELGDELSSKYEDLSVNEFNLKTMTLIDTISKQIASYHKSSWMRSPFSTEELKIDDSGILNIRDWIRASA